MNLCVLLGLQWFLTWMPFLPSLFLIGESWTLTLTVVTEAWSSLGVFLGSFVAYMWCGWALEETLIDQSLLGRFTTVPFFFKFLDNSSHSESLEYQHFRNGFVTAPAVIKLFVWWSETIWQICKNIRDQEKDHFSEHCMFMPSPLVICG